MLTTLPTALPSHCQTVSRLCGDVRGKVKRKVKNSTLGTDAEGEGGGGTVVGDGAQEGRDGGEKRLHVVCRVEENLVRHQTTTST